MNAAQNHNPQRSRIPKIAAVACSLVLMAGYVHFSATGKLIPGMDRPNAQQPPAATATSDSAHSQSGEAQSEQPIQTLFPSSKDGMMFPGSKSRMLIEPTQETRREFLGGSKSLEIFDEHDVVPLEVPTTLTPSTQPETGE